MPSERLERDFFEKMPKAELHLHMDGAIPPEDVWGIHNKRGTGNLPFISEQSLEVLKRETRLPAGMTLRDPKDFDRFLGMFAPTLAVMQTPSGLQDTAYTHVEHLTKQNHVYAETRFAPQYHLRKGLLLEDVIHNVLIGLEAGRLETGTRVKLIICIGREIDVEGGKNVARAALEFQDRGVVALDLACNESDHPPEKHLSAFQLTFGSRLKRTMHAGEFASDEEQKLENVRTALSCLKAHGLGHATSLVDMQDSLDSMVEDGIRLESCPLSNRTTGAVSDIRQLGLDRLLESDVLVSLNTDDPAIFGTSLADVFEETCRIYSFEEEHVRRFTRNAVLGAFCSDEERAEILSEFKARGMAI